MALSPFWAEAVFHFWKLQPSLSLDASLPDISSIVRCLPLFKNPLFMLTGKSLTGNRWKLLAKKGIYRLADIVFNNRLGTFEEMSDFYGRISFRAYNDLCKAIPHHILTIVSDHPWTASPDSPWAYYDSSGTFTPIAFSSVGSISDELRTLARPYKVTHKGPVFLDTLEIPSSLVVDSRDAASLRTSEIRLILSALALPLFPKYQTIWQDLDVNPSSWSTVYRKLWKAPVNSKYKDLCWLISRNSLFTGDIARKCNSQSIPHNCLCGHPETLSHIFLECEAAKTIWDLVSLKWMEATGFVSPPSPSLATLATSGWDLHPKSSKWHKSLWQILSMTALYVIWAGRCHNVYGDTPSNYVGKFIVNIRRVKKLAIRALPDLRVLQLL